MKKPSVTVLVTVKNSKRTVDNCINSILKLDYPNYKIFVTDAYSDDGTFESLKKLQKNHPQKIKLEQIEGNIATAHNYMIKKTNTDFVAFTDADCVVHKNWLKNLISAFKPKNIIAVAGFCSTPKNVNKLQKLIGLELEDRFKRFPMFISRAPTMNLCVITKFAKKVKFDEKFDVAQETDWGYRLTKFGNMIYVPNAVIYHYHRPTLKSFLKQHGFKYGRSLPRLYLKHPKKSTGDHISKPTMLLQEFIFSFFSLFLVLSLFYNNLIVVAIFLLIFLFVTYFIDILRFTKNPKNILIFIGLYMLRNIFWTIGLIFGIFDLIF